MAMMQFPGFCDVHVHFRDPGYEYKETMRTGSMAAAAGGYTAVCTMPNLNPVPDCPEHLAVQQKIIQETALVHIYPYASITIGQKGQTLVDMAQIAGCRRAAEHCCGTGFLQDGDPVGFSDDGKGIQQEEMMLQAMLRAKASGKLIVAHCEDNSLLHGGYIHDGAYAKMHDHAGICSASEWKQIERDLALAKETGCGYHVCHISCAESVELIRKAKADGVDVTCETGPHYLTLDDSFLQEDGRFKMNPPIRSRSDRDALIEGVLDGTVDMIATDHAPHSAEEKSRGLKGSAFGIVGLETAFAVLNTFLIRPGIVSMERILEMLTAAPRKRFGIPLGEDYCVWDTEASYIVDPEQFRSMGKATPYAGMRLYGVCLKTVVSGRTVYERQDRI